MYACVCALRVCLPVILSACHKSVRTQRNDFGGDTGYYLGMNEGDVVAVTEVIESDDGANWAL